MERPMSIALQYSSAQRYALPILATLAIHVALLMLLQPHEPSSRRFSQSEQRSVLLLRPTLRSAPTIERQSSSPLEIKPRQKDVTQPPPSRSTAITFPAPIEAETLAQAPDIDWHNESERSAKSVVSEAHAPPKQRSLDSRPAGAEAGSNEKPVDFDWSLSSKPYGLTPDGLPYIHLGERCVYVLPMPIIACGFGAKPPPNRNLFERMGDPNLPDSSVPK